MMMMTKTEAHGQVTVVVCDFVGLIVYWLLKHAA